MIGFVRMKTKVFSIKVKFTLAAVLISLISYGIAAFLSTRWLAEEIKEDYRDKARLMLTHILHDLETSMLRKQHAEVFGTLDIYKNYKDVEEIRIFDPTGKEIFTDEPGPAEPRVEEALRTGEPIHFEKATHKREVQAFILPIKNKPECHHCHGESEPLRGAILLSLGQEGMDHYIREQKRKFVILFGVIAVAISATTILAVNRLFLRPLRQIQKGAEAMEKGDFEHQIPLSSEDEIGALTQNFNQMAQTLKSYFKTLEEKNRQLEEQFLLLSRSQKEWQESFDCITDPMAVIDGHCHLIRANQAFKTVFKDYTPSQENNKMDRMCSELFGTCLVSHCPLAMETQDKKPGALEIHDQKTGMMFELSLFPHESMEGRARGSIVILKDVTEKKENEMRQIMNERLAALGQMASGIAHELNNPLATIAASAEGLLKRVEKENIGSLLFRSYLKIIEEEIQRCKKITGGMLSLVRRTDHGKKEINVNDVLDKTIDIISFQGRLKEVEVFRNHQREMPKIIGNEGELMQVFLSIMGNALDAMEDRGTLTLETGTEGKSIFIKICDSGPGIPPEAIHRIFDPFFTTKSEKGGTGLGLAIAEKIIKDHGGHIEVTTEDGKGTTFRVILSS